MKLRAAVIGLGHLGRHHARILNPLPGVQLECICDTDPAKFEQAECPREVRRTLLPEDAWHNADIVVVAVPTRSHLEIALPALQAARDVLVEKPLAAQVEDGRALVAAAKLSGVVLGCGHVERFNGALQGLELPPLEPRFLEGHRLAGFTSRSLDVDVVLDLMIHDLDLALSLVRRPVDLVEAVGVPVISPQVDIANARLTFEGGCVANLTASRISEGSTRKLRIFDRDAYYSLDFAAGQAGVTRLKPGPGGIPVPKRSMHSGAGEPLCLELEDFVAACRDRRAGAAHRGRGASGEEALAALVLAVRVREAMARHRQTYGTKGA